MSCLLSIVVPVYNEEQTLPKFLAAIRPVLAEVTEDYEIIFVADPCTDRTVEMIRAEHERDPRVKLLLFSRRFGQPAATIGGMTYASGPSGRHHRLRPAGPAAADSRDGAPVARGQQGRHPAAHVARGRDADQADRLLRRLLGHQPHRDRADSAQHGRLSAARSARGPGDRQACARATASCAGSTSVVGFKTVLVPFNRDARAAGEGKYNRLTGSLKIGFNGIVAFSDSLLRLMVVVGITMAGVALLAIPVVAVLKAYNLYSFVAGPGDDVHPDVVPGRHSARSAWGCSARTWAAPTRRRSGVPSSSSTSRSGSFEEGS